MYLIHKDENKIEAIPEKTFSDLGFKERENLQEWLADNPKALGEDLLIIQKEFSGFDQTNERPDLLALDKNGNIVIIENKLDDSGRDVTWQALKYASYCSTLKRSDIIQIFREYLEKLNRADELQDKLACFFENGVEIENKRQRIFLVAGKFRMEVTSTVLWLAEYGLDIKCFKVTPYQLNSQLFLDVEQIIPIKEASEYMIKIASKTREENENTKSQELLKGFWSTLLPELKNETELFSKSSITKNEWMSCGSGIGLVVYELVVRQSYARIQFYISTESQDKNKEIFSFLFAKKDTIESKIEIDNVYKLVWDKMNDKKASKIFLELPDVNVYNKENWPSMVIFFKKYLPKFELAFKDCIQSFRMNSRQAKNYESQASLEEIPN